ncbi:MAG TPA: nicotinate phosphoribosyltransferase, partial [Actinomycetota bacterium]
LRGIRLDSGDLGELAHRARAMLDEAGLSEVRIFASGGLDERKVAELANTPIDAFGVGSKVGVAEDSPTLDSVYKLVEYDGRPVAKLSTAKATLPGRKQVFRTEGGDTLALRDESLPGEPVLVPAMRSGERLNRDTWREARDRCRADLAALPEDRHGLDAPPIEIRRSEALAALDEEIRAGIRRRELSQ